MITQVLLLHSTVQTGDGYSSATGQMMMYKSFKNTSTFGTRFGLSYMVLKAVQIILTCCPLGTWQSICLSGTIYIASPNRVGKTSTMFFLQFTLEEQIMVEDGMRVQVNQN
jgi:hypothetical protein